MFLQNGYNYNGGVIVVLGKCSLADSGDSSHYRASIMDTLKLAGEIFPGSWA